MSRPYPLVHTHRLPITRGTISIDLEIDILVLSATHLQERSLDRCPLLDERRQGEQGVVGATLGRDEWGLLRRDLDIRYPATDACPLLRFGRWQDQHHQHLPAARLASSPWSGLLIADEVGLGKTISALHVLRRLHAIGESGGILVAVPGGLRLKWLQEMFHRCDLIGYEADNGAKLRQAFDRIKEGEPLVVVTSHGILRQAKLLHELMEEGPPEFLLTIIDEAHHCRNPRSRLHDAVQLITLHSKQTLFLTATPVNLSNEELWIQLSLLAPDRWPDHSSFERTMQPMAFLNTALDATSRTEPDLEKALGALNALASTPGFAGDPRLETARDICSDPLGWIGNRVEERRREVADLIRQLRPLNELVVRTRRRDLDLRLARREALTLDVSMTPAEWRLYEAARRWTWRLMQLRHPDSDRFDWALVIPERMASSSLPAFARHVQTQLRTAARNVLDFGVEGGDELDDVTMREAEHRLLNRFGDLDELIDAADELGDVDSKYEAMRTWLFDSLNEDQVGGVLLFSHFRGTLAHLKAKLTADGVSCEVLSGSTKMTERENLRNRFANGEFEVLLSSEVGSEGLDQQHCHRLVNYDLPWNPMRIEQRIGRLDRFGQEAEVITILNLAVEGTIDAAILNRLYRRIRLFEDSIGMLDPMLGKAMRLVAQTELRQPMGRNLGQGGMQMVEAWEAEQFSTAVEPNTGRDDVDSLLIQRERWLTERAVEEREWLGNDPGIRQLREDSERLELGLEPEQLVEWVIARLSRVDPNASLYQHNDEWHLKLSDTSIQTLYERATDVKRSDSLTVGWLDEMERCYSGGSANIIQFSLGRDGANCSTARMQLAPWHPLVQWLREPLSGEADEDAPLPGWRAAGISPSHRLTTKRPENWPEEARTLICLDWTVSALNRHAVRRWLLFDENGLPVPDQPETAWADLDNLEFTTFENHEEDALEESLDNLHGWLLEDEQARLAPLLAELRHNVQRSWMGRIDREREQIEAAQFRAHHRETEVDPRWLTMKRGLIARLIRELNERILHLDKIREGLQAELAARVVVRLEF